MKHKIKLSLIILIALFFAGCFTEEMKIEPKGILSGTVVDTEGKTVENVKIVMGAFVTYTSSHGAFSISNIDVGGDPKEYIYISKNNYIPTYAEANFKSSLSVDNSGKVDGLPLKNAAASVKVTMTEIVTLKGGFIFPDTPNITSLKLVPKLIFAGSQQKYSPKTTYTSVITNNKEFEIKDVPRLGIETSTHSSISSINYKVFLNNKTYADYYYKETEPENLNLETKTKTYGSDQSYIDIGEINLNKYYVLSGKVYINEEQLQLAQGNRQTLACVPVTLMKGTAKIKDVVTDADGNYSFQELEAGSDYSLVLGTADTNGDGIPEYIGSTSFDNIMVNGKDIAKDLWYDSKYSILSGKVYTNAGQLLLLEPDRTTVPNIPVVLKKGTFVIGECITDAAGAYRFTTLAPGTDYSIELKDADTDGDGEADYLNSVLFSGIIIKGSGGNVNKNVWFEAKCSKLTGKIYGGPDQLSLPENNRTVVTGVAITLKKGTAVIKTTTSDSNGQYTFKNLTPGTDYSIELKDADADGDGREEYINSKVFDNITINADGRDIIRNVWFEGRFLYSITGKAYAGNIAQNITLSGIRIDLYNGTSLVDVTTTNANGEYTFSNVTYKSVTVMAEGKDINLNGKNDFKGYDAADSSTNAAKADISSLMGENLSNIDLALPANQSEPEFKPEVVSTNFTIKNPDGTFTAAAITAAGTDLTITFSMPISDDAVNDITHIGERIVTIDGGAVIPVTVVLSTDKKQLVVTPLVTLSSATNYAVTINNKLGTARGYTYGFNMQNQSTTFTVTGKIVN